MPLLLTLIMLVISLTAFLLNNYKVSTLFLVLTSFAVGCFIALLDPYLELWDEQIHALVAKNMSIHPFKPMLYNSPILPYKSENWVQNHIWLHKQPLFLWQIAISIKLLGTTTFAVRLPSIIMHAITTFFIYDIGKKAFNYKAGYAGALFFTFSFYALELISGKKSTDHNDVAFIFYITASIWAWFKYQNSKTYKWAIIIGLFSACAILVKWLTGLLIFSGWGLSLIFNSKSNLNLKEIKRLAVSLIVCGITFIPWTVYIFSKFPKEANIESQLNTSHFFNVVENHNGSWWFHFKALHEHYGNGLLTPLIILIATVVAFKTIKNKNYKVILITTVVIVYTFFTLAETKMLSFCFIVSPILFLFIGNLITKLLTIINHKLIHKVIYITVVLSATYLFFNISKIEQNHTFKKPKDNFKRGNELFSKYVSDYIGASQLNNTVIFNTNITRLDNISLMYYNNCIAYDRLLTKNEILKIKSKKYKLIVYDFGDLPKNIRNDNSIKKIPLRSLFKEFIQVELKKHINP